MKNSSALEKPPKGVAMENRNLTLQIDTPSSLVGHVEGPQRMLEFESPPRQHNIL